MKKTNPLLNAILCLALAVFGLTLFSYHASAQVLLSSGTYSQNFDALPSTVVNSPWTNNVTLVGWYAGASNSTAATFGGTGSTGAPTNIIVSAGAGNAGGLYSFGTNGVNPVTDRALGSISSGTPQQIGYGVRFTNDTGVSLTNFTISYIGEEWRNGGNSSVQSLAFSYRVDSLSITNPDPTNTTAWTSVSALIHPPWGSQRPLWMGIIQPIARLLQARFQELLFCLVRKYFCAGLISTMRVTITESQWMT